MNHNSPISYSQSHNVIIRVQDDTEGISWAVARGEIWKNQPQKQGKSGKMGRKRANWEENGKLAGSLPLRKERAGYGPDFSGIQSTLRAL